MKYFVSALCLCGLAFAQQPAFAPLPKDQPIAAPVKPPPNYSGYVLLLVGPPGSEQVAPVIVNQQVTYIRLSEVKQAMDSGATAISFGDVQQFMGQLISENQRLKQENERLWRIAENRPATSQQPTVIVQTPPQASPDPNAQRRAVQMMILQRMFAPTQTINVNTCDRSKTVCYP